MSRILIDATGAVSGGIVRVLLETVRHWPSGDDLHVIAGASVTGRLPETATGHPLPDSRRSTLLFSAARELPRVRHALRPDAVVSISPSLPAAALRPDVTVLHDLFFRLWPSAESAAVRSYRALSYRRALSASRSIACVSDRTRHDLSGWLPELSAGAWVWPLAPAAAFLSGPAQRGPSDAEGGESYVVVPAHNDYKGAELAVSAIRGEEAPSVHLLAGSEGRARELSQRFQHSARVPTVLPYLSDEEMAKHLSSASALVMPSHIEGFGLPVVEALALATPVVVSPDPALWESSGGYAVRMGAWSPASVRESFREVTAIDTDHWARAQAWARRRTWSEAAAELRGRALGSPTR